MFHVAVLYNQITDSYGGWFFVGLTSYIHSCNICCMGSPDAQETRYPLHDPESGFGLTLEDLGGISHWSRRDMLGEERVRQTRDEAIGIYNAEGFMHTDPETGEAFISERPEGGGRNMRMSDILPLDRLDDAVEIEIIVRARELPEDDEVRVDTSNESPSIPLWSPRG